MIELELLTSHRQYGKRGDRFTLADAGLAAALESRGVARIIARGGVPVSIGKADPPASEPAPEEEAEDSAGSMDETSDE